MGGHSYNPYEAKELLHHPNFKLPAVPSFLKTKQDEKSMAIANYVIDCVASFLSPSPQLQNEDQDFDCKDLAKTIREDLAPQIREKLFKARIR